MVVMEMLEGDDNEVCYVRVATDVELTFGQQKVVRTNDGSGDRLIYLKDLYYTVITEAEKIHGVIRQLKLLETKSQETGEAEKIHGVIKRLKSLVTKQENGDIEVDNAKLEQLKEDLEGLENEVDEAKLKQLIEHLEGLEKTAKKIGKACFKWGRKGSS